MLMQLCVLLCSAPAGNNKLFNPFADEENDKQKSSSFTFYRCGEHESANKQQAHDL